MINIIEEQSLFLETNMYIIQCEGHAIVIDPSPDVDFKMYQELSIDKIILTHEHYDHICGVNMWKEKFGCPVLCGEKAEDKLGDPKKNMSHYSTAIFLTFPGYEEFKDNIQIIDYTCKADSTIGNNEVINWRGNQFLAFETPGHSEGSICLLVNDKFLFCGDTMLAHLPTGVRWKGASKRAFKDITIPKLKNLRGDTLVYPGHGENFIMSNYRFWEETT